MKTKTSQLPDTQEYMRFLNPFDCGIDKLPDTQGYLRAAAFREWQQGLKLGNKLPRGKFFRGKQAGILPRIFIIDIGIC